MVSTAHRPSVRVSGLISAGGRVLLVRQAAGERTYWLLPGGGVLRGETVNGALAREVEEECGVAVSEIGPPFALVESISPDGGRQRHVLQLILGARFRGDPVAARPVDPAILEVAWFLPTDVAHLALHPPVSDLLPGWVAHLDSHPLTEPPPFVATGVRWAP